LRTRHFSLIAGAAVALLSLFGCQQEGIEVHRVPIPQPPEPKVRLLGAIVPHDPDTWVFKVVGKLDAIEPIKDDFEKFVRSVRFDKKDEPITWDLPARWKKEPVDPNNQFGSYARFLIDPDGAKLTVTVSQLPGTPQARSKFENVARWGRNDVGVKVAQGDEIDYIHEDQTAGGTPITFVDMKGPGASGGGMKPPFARGMKNPHAAQEKITYTVPEGWKETEREVERQGIVVRYEAALKVEEGGASALLTVSKFPGAAGGLLQNVNRWRTDQLGLPPLDKEQFVKASEEVRVDKVRSIAVDFTGPGNPKGKGERRILGIIVPREEQLWFIKMDGPADLIGKQKGNFDKFVGSVKFEGGNGG
jgi:hypothetical protein